MVCNRPVSFDSQYIWILHSVADDITNIYFFPLYPIARAWLSATVTVQNAKDSANGPREGRKRERHKRVVGVCFVGQQSLNAETIRQGGTLAYCKYSRDYIAQEAAAKWDKIRILLGQFVSPWDWWRVKRLHPPVAVNCRKNCRKGKAYGNTCVRVAYTCQKPQGALVTQDNTVTFGWLSPDFGTAFGAKLCYDLIS